MASGYDPHSVDYLRELSKHPPLSAERERELVSRWKEHNDPRAREKLIEGNLRSVSTVAWTLRGYGAPMEELAAEGCLGLMESIDNFDPSRGTRLITYVSWWIRAAMLKAIIKHYRKGRTGSLDKHFWKVRRASRMVDSEIGRIQRISEDTGLDEEDSARALSAMRWDSQVDSLQLVADSMEDRLDYDQRMRTVIEDMDKTLSVKEYIIIKSTFLGRGASTLLEIGSTQGVTRECTRQKKVRALKKIRRYLKVA